MSDYISREDAIEECNWYAKEFCECEYAIMPLRGAIKSIPAADVVEQKHGKWILKHYEGSSGVYRCSACKARGRKQIFLFNYCPDCGARMDGEDDGHT